MWILSSREKVLDIWCEVFMESFRAYLKQTKIFFIACVFMAAVSTAVICLYQLPLEAAVYLAVLWLGAGAAVFLLGQGPVSRMEFFVFRKMECWKQINHLLCEWLEML